MRREKKHEAKQAFTAGLFKRQMQVHALTEQVPRAQVCRNSPPPEVRDRWLLVFSFYQVYVTSRATRTTFTTTKKFIELQMAWVSDPSGHHEGREPQYAEALKKLAGYDV